ncbi:MAG TPA: hypothetical protein VNX68_07755 [Nitrosopumilaceae archaeon]|jgi:hypothetical protein|nr:hypothetical protein [Nitrosopumilaceae archaeon]
MSKLTPNWLTENHIDFEYKKYVLLAYLQEVEAHYKDAEVYPWLAEVIEHYRNLNIVKNNTETLKKGFQKEVNGFDWKTLNLTYNNPVEDNELITELNLIIEYSIPLFHNCIIDGKKIYDFVEEHLKLQAVGITPLNIKEGYLLIHTDKQNDVNVFQYGFSALEDSNENSKSLSTKYICTYTSNLSWSYEKVKNELIRTYKELPNPAVYAIDCSINVPFKETLFPVAKRYFVHKMAA